MNPPKKISISLSVLSLIIIAASCRKEVPYDKKNYIGTWDNAAGNTQIYIDASGKGRYYSNNGIGYVKIEGNVIFDGNNFRISAGFAKKKVTVDKYPSKTIVTLNPYVYYYSARFNGEEYRREEK